MSDEHTAEYIKDYFPAAGQVKNAVREKGKSAAPKFHVAFLQREVHQR